MTTLAQRLRLAMQGPPKVSQAALARACGIKPPSVSNWLDGRTKALEGANLLAAAKALGVTPEWLATGSGPMKNSQAESQGVGQDAERMRAAAKFLEDLFAHRGKVFVASEQIPLLLAVYTDLASTEEPNLVALTFKYGERLKGDADERQGKTGGSGKDGGSRDRRRAS